jgi:hypothetical protein
MPRDYGLLQGLASGMQGAMDGYMAVKKMQREDQKLEQEKQRGLIEAQTKEYLAKIQGEDIERKRRDDEESATNKQMEIFTKLKGLGYEPGLNEIYPYDTDSPINAELEYTRKFPQPQGIVGEAGGVDPMTGAPRMQSSPEWDKWQQGLIDSRKGTGRYKLNLKNLGAGIPQVKEDNIKAGTGLIEAKTKDVPLQRSQRVIKPTPGQAKVDTEFGKFYNEYPKRKQIIRDNISSLENAYNELTSGKKNYSGDDLAAYRGFGSSLTSQDSMQMQRKIQDAIKSGLKSTFGGSALSDKDVEIFFGTTFDPKLDEKANAESLRKVINSLKAEAADTDKRVKHFEINKGTLLGYKSSGSQMFGARPRPASGGSQKPSPGHPDKMQNGRRFRWNEAEKKYKVLPNG